MKLDAAEIDQLALEDRKHYMSLSDAAQKSYAQQWRRNKYQPATKEYYDRPKASIMLIAGRIGFAISIIIAAIALLQAKTSYYSPDYTWVFIGSSGAGTFALMWMLGAIEQRLHEIRFELSNR